MTIANDIVRRSLAKGFDEAVANVFLAKRTYLKIAESKIDSLVDKYYSYATLFVSSKKRLFFININELDKRGIANAIENAWRSVKKIKPKDDYYGIAEGPFKYNFESDFDKKTENYTNDDMIDIANAGINSALETGADVVAGTVFVGSLTSWLSTSKKVEASDKGTEVRLSLRVFRNDLSFQNSMAANSFSKMNSAKFGKDAVEMLGNVKGLGRIESGVYDVVYTQTPAASILSNVNDMACIGSVETGNFLSGKLNNSIADKSITLYDVGAMKGSVNSSPFDDEGYPSQKTKVIENGILKHYLHNYSTGKKYNTQSTGNAGLVDPDPNVLLFEHKKRVKGIGQLIGKVDKGILITNTWYTRFSNYLTGDFSTVPRDLAIYIEKGEPKFAIKQRHLGSFVGIRVSENMMRMLRNIECAANDTMQATSWEDEGDYDFAPSILVNDVRITTA